ATVHVRVNDVNEFSPVFVERRYEASVPEGRLFDRIVRVEALDADCSPQYSQICFYDIITPTVPFAIDNDGAVRGEVDLLPPPSPAANWTSALPTLPSSDSSLVFSFNGSSHVAVVPDLVVSALSGDHFTLQLWMRRGATNIQPSTPQSRGNRKEEETIVCSTVKNGVFNLWDFNDEVVLEEFQCFHYNLV
ncbi:hypothetical protein XENOCAPTIV_030855, partial [Xenoophorus captivus]